MASPVRSRMPSLPSLLLLVLLLCCACPSLVFGALSGQLLLSTSPSGCTSLAPLVAGSPFLAIPLGGALAACPGYNYTQNAVSPAPTSLSVALSAVDPAGPAGGTMHLVEATSSGANMLTSSPLADRSSTVRFPFPAGLTVVAMELGLPAAVMTIPTPLYIIAATPQLSLGKFSPVGSPVSSWAWSDLLSTSALKTTFNMSHALSGALVLRNDGPSPADVRELMFVGLSGNTPRLPSGAVDTSKIKLYVVSLDATTGNVVSTNEFPIVGAAGVVSVHYAAELHAILLVCASEIVALPVPTGGFIPVAKDTPQSVVPISVSAPVSSASFVFSAQIGPTFQAIYTSSRWVPLARQLLVAVEHTDDSIELLALDMSALSSTSFVSTGRSTLPATGTLPLILQTGIAPLGISAAAPAALPSATATLITVSGQGFSQPLVRDQLMCTFTAADASGSPLGSSVTAPATLTHAVSDPSSPEREQLQCTLPAGVLAGAGAGAKLLLVSVSSINGEVTSGTTAAEAIKVDVDECTSAGAATLCGSSTACNNTVGGFTCVVSACPPGSTGANLANCTLCPANSFKSAWGSSACINCPLQATAPAGSTAAVACVLADICDSGVPLRGGGSKGGADASARMVISLPLTVANFSTPAAQLLFRMDIARALGLTDSETGATSADRIGPIEKVQGANNSPTGPPILVTFSILPPNANEHGKCVSALAQGLNYTSANGQSAASLANTLQATLSDPYNTILSQSHGQLNGEGSVVGDPEAILPLREAPDYISSFGAVIECAAQPFYPIAVYAGLLLASVLVFMMCPCRRPGRDASNPLSPRARPWEVMAATLPLWALGFDVAFLSKQSFEPLVAAVGIIVLGIVHNVWTMVHYGSPQAKLAGDAAVAPANNGNNSASIPAYPPNANGEKGGPPPANTSLPLWSKAHPTASRIAVLLGALNIASLGLWSSQLNTRSGAFDISWDPLRPRSQPYNQMVWKGGVRQLFLRQAPMLALQLWVISSQACESTMPAALLASFLALLVLVGRTVFARVLVPEPGTVANRYVVRKNGWKVGEAEESVRSSRVKTAAGEVQMSRLNRNTSVRQGADSDSDGEDDESGLGVRALAPGEFVVADHEAERLKSFVEMILTEEEEAAAAAMGLKTHEWIIVENALEPAPADDGTKRIARRVPRNDAARIETRRASMLAESMAPLPSVAEVVVRAAKASAAAREVAASNMWMLFDDPSVEVPSEAQLAATDTVIKKVEQFQEVATGEVPFAPACFRVYLAKKKDVVKREEERKKIANDEANRLRVQAAEEAQRAIDADGVWVILDDPKPRAVAGPDGESLPPVGAVVQPVLLPGEEVKSVEVFDEYNAPFNPPLFKRYVKKSLESKRAEVKAQALAEAKAALEKAQQEATAKAARAIARAEKQKQATERKAAKRARAQSAAAAAAASAAAAARESQAAEIAVGAVEAQRAEVEMMERRGGAVVLHGSSSDGKRSGSVSRHDTTAAGGSSKSKSGLGSIATMTSGGSRGGDLTEEVRGVHHLERQASQRARLTRGGSLTQHTLMIGSGSPAFMASRTRRDGSGSIDMSPLAGPSSPHMLANQQQGAIIVKGEGSTTMTAGSSHFVLRRADEDEFDDDVADAISDLTLGPAALGAKRSGAADVTMRDESTRVHVNSRQKLAQAALAARVAVSVSQLTREVVKPSGKVGGDANAEITGDLSAVLGGGERTGISALRRQPTTSDSAAAAAAARWNSAAVKVPTVTTPAAHMGNLGQELAAKVVNAWSVGGGGGGGGGLGSLGKVNFDSDGEDDDDAGSAVAGATSGGMAARIAAMRRQRPSPMRMSSTSGIGGSPQFSPSSNAAHVALADSDLTSTPIIAAGRRAGMQPGSGSLNRQASQSSFALGSPVSVAAVAPEFGSPLSSPVGPAGAPRPSPIGPRSTGLRAMMLPKQA